MKIWIIKNIWKMSSFVQSYYFLQSFQFPRPRIRKKPRRGNERIPRMLRIKRKVCAFFCFSGMLEAWAVIWEAAALATVAACWRVWRSWWNKSWPLTPRKRAWCLPSPAGSPRCGKCPLSPTYPIQRAPWVSFSFPSPTIIAWIKSIRFVIFYSTNARRGS